MRRIALPLALITLAVALPATAFDPIDTDRRALLGHLAHSRALFTESVAGLTPEQVRPASRWASIEAAMAHFEESRAKTVALVRDAGDLRAHAAEHPAFGNLDAIGWTYFLSGHTERHTLQIEEIKVAPGFPAG